MEIYLILKQSSLPMTSSESTPCTVFLDKDKAITFTQVHNAMDLNNHYYYQRMAVEDG